VKEEVIGTYPMINGSVMVSTDVTGTWVAEVYFGAAGLS